MIALAPDEVAGEVVDGEEAAVPEEAAAGYVQQGAAHEDEQGADPVVPAGE
jgi:hypothetical protein